MRLLMICGLIASLLLTTGCGGCGGTSQEEMKRRAIRRPSGDDDKTSSAPTTPVPATAGSPSQGATAPNNAASRDAAASSSTDAPVAIAGPGGTLYPRPPMLDRDDAASAAPAVVGNPTGVVNPRPPRLDRDDAVSTASGELRPSGVGGVLPARPRDRDDDNAAPVLPGGVNASGGSTASGPRGADGERLPVPDEAEQKKAKALLREVYKDDYNTPKGKRDQWRKFASKLLAQEQRTREDPAGRYVLLIEAAGIAADEADVRTAMRAVDLLERSYQVDALALRVDFIDRANSAGELTMSDNKSIVDTAERLIKEAMSQDNYAAAEALYDAAIAAARRTREKAKLVQVTAHREDLDEAQAAFREVHAAIEKLRSDPDDPDANLDVGKYLCFVKQRWDRGLPHLARGSHVELRGLANLELQANHAPEQMIEIADLWWKLGEKTPKLHRKWLWLRAAYWYREAMPLLPASLLKLHAETQLKRAEEEYGKDEVAQRPVS